MTGSIRVGAVDWRRPDWNGTFYPADMPEEWRLTFYSSQFNCVYLEAAAWQGVDAAELARWHDDVHSRFVFLLAAAPGWDCPAALGEKARIVVPQAPDVLWFDGGSDLKALAGRLKEDTGHDGYLISRDGDLGQMERVGTLLELMGF